MTMPYLYRQLESSPGLMELLKDALASFLPQQGEYRGPMPDSPQYLQERMLGFDPMTDPYYNVDLSQAAPLAMGMPFVKGQWLHIPGGKRINGKYVSLSRKAVPPAVRESLAERQRPGGDLYVEGGRPKGRRPQHDVEAQGPGSYWPEDRPSVLMSHAGPTDRAEYNALVREINRAGRSTSPPPQAPAPPPTQQSSFSLSDYIPGLGKLAGGTIGTGMTGLLGLKVLEALRQLFGGGQESQEFSGLSPEAAEGLRMVNSGEIDRLADAVHYANEEGLTRMAGDPSIEDYFAGMLRSAAGEPISQGVLPMMRKPQPQTSEWRRKYGGIDPISQFLAGR